MIYGKETFSIESGTVTRKAPKKNRGGFIVNTLTLVGGNVIAQAIVVALMPIITRLYPPQTFGIFSIFVSATLVTMAVSHLRYNVAILLPSDEEDADALALLGIIVVFVMSSLLLFTIIICGPKISEALNMQEFTYIFFLVPLATLFGGIGLILNSWYLRAKEFKRLAISKVSGATGDRITTLALGFQGLIGPEGLVLGRLTGNVFTIGAMLLRQETRHIFSICSLSSLKRLKKVAIRYKKFPKYVWSGLFNQLSFQAPVIILGYFFTPTVVGLFALSRRVLAEPMQLIGESLSRSFFQKASETHNMGKDSAQLSERLLHYLILFVLFPMALLGLTSVEVFSVVFGEKWQEAGVYTALLVPTFTAIFLCRPISVFFDLLEKQKEAFIFNVLLFLVNAAILSVGGVFGNPLLTIGLFSASSTLLFASRIVWLLSKIGVSLNSCARMLGFAIARTLVFSFPVISLKLFCSPTELTVVIIAVLSLVLYYMHLFLTDTYLKNEVMLIIKH